MPQWCTVLENIGNHPSGPGQIPNVELRLPYGTRFPVLGATGL